MASILASLVMLSLTLGATGCAMSHPGDDNDASAAPAAPAAPDAPDASDAPYDAGSCATGDCADPCADGACVEPEPCAETPGIACATFDSYLKASNTGGGQFDPYHLGDSFGGSVSVSGDTLVIGAPREDSGATGIDGGQADDSLIDSGAVYVFRRSGATWVQDAYLKAERPGAGDMFGTSVSLDGDTLVVGAYGEDSAAVGVNGDQADDSLRASGAAYVFRRVGTTWAQAAYLKPSDTALDEWFGASVSVSGDTVAVGAHYADVRTRTGTKTWAGTAYVFRRTGTTWSEEARLEASNAGTRHFFAAHLSLSGDTLAVGAHGEASAATGIDGNREDDSAPQSGAVYVYRRSGTTWAEEAYLKASNTALGDFFGWAVSLDGDTVAVGARAEDSAAVGAGGDQEDDTANDSGAVYVFRRSGATWTQVAYLKASSTGGADFFGEAVSLSGDTLAVGAPLEDSADTGVDGEQEGESATSSGAVYLFRGSEMGWAQVAFLKATNTGVGDAFGWSVSLDASTLVAGAPFEHSAAIGVNGDGSDDSAAASGAAYTFRIVR